MTSLAQASGTRPVGRPPLMAMLPSLMVTSSSWATSRVVLAPLSVLALSMVVMFSASSVIPRPVTFTLSLPLLGWLAWAGTSDLTRALAFLKTLPLAVGSRSLVLAPLCALAVLVVAVALVVLPVGVADGAAVLALSWWTFVAGHWLAPRRPWLAALVMPVVCWLPLVPAAFVAKSGGDWAAAAVCAAFALGGLLLSPRDQTERLLTGVSRGRAAGALSPAMSRAAIPPVSRARRPTLFGTVWRVWVISTPRPLRYALILATVPAIGLGIASFPLVSAQWLQFPMLLGILTSQCASRETLAFLSTRPIRRRHLLMATLLPAAVFLLALHFCWLAMVRSESFIGPQAHVMFPPSRATAEKLRFLRQVLGATFLPARLAPGGLPPEMWPALRGLLLQHLARVALLCLAFTYSIVGLAMAGGRKREGARRWWRALLLVGTLAAVLPCLPAMWAWRFPWSPAPLWLAACLAVASLISAGAHHFRPVRPHAR